MSGIQRSDGEIWTRGNCEGTSPRELGVGLKRASLGDQCSVSSAGGTQKTWKAVVRRESADTQEYDSCQLNDMNVVVVEDKEELSFVPSAVSSFG